MMSTVHYLYLVWSSAFNSLVLRYMITFQNFPFRWVESICKSSYFCNKMYHSCHYKPALTTHRVIQNIYQVICIYLNDENYSQCHRCHQKPFQIRQSNRHSTPYINKKNGPLRISIPQFCYKLTKVERPSNLKALEYSSTKHAIHTVGNTSVVKLTNVAILSR